MSHVKASIPDPPSWLDAGFVQTALHREFPDTTVTSLVITPAVAAGENYNCLVYRASVATSSRGPISLIIKCMPQNESRVNYIRQCEITAREIQMYTHALPILLEESSSSLTLRYPLCYHILQDNVRDTLVLEDLSQQGYKTHPRQTGLNAAHCKVAISELAKMHGLSVALRVNKPDSFNKNIVEKYYDTTYGERYRDVYMPYLKSIFTSLAKSIKINLQQSRFKTISEIIKNMNLDKIYTDIIACSKLSKNDIIVLNHGDYWSNNILFKYNKEEPESCSVIDFQTSFCASPALDLLYFFYTSTTQATRRALMDDLLQLYLHEARQAMRERGVADPGAAFYRDVAHIKQDMQRHRLRGLVDACCVMPVVIADPKDVLDLRSVHQDNEFSPVAKLYSGPLFCQRFRELLEDFDDMGLFMELAGLQAQ